VFMMSIEVSGSNDDGPSTADKVVAGAKDQEKGFPEMVDFHYKKLNCMRS
ncbi:hypothetical protein COLO4_33211, partial [Corchorus olitorius]